MRGIHSLMNVIPLCIHFFSGNPIRIIRGDALQIGIAGFSVISDGHQIRDSEPLGFLSGIQQRIDPHFVGDRRIFLFDVAHLVHLERGRVVVKNCFHVRNYVQFPNHSQRR